MTHQSPTKSRPSGAIRSRARSGGAGSRLCLSRSPRTPRREMQSAAGRPGIARVARTQSSSSESLADPHQRRPGNRGGRPPADASCSQASRTLPHVRRAASRRALPAQRTRPALCAQSRPGERDIDHSSHIITHKMNRRTTPSSTLDHPPPWWKSPAPPLYLNPRGCDDHLTG